VGLLTGVFAGGCVSFGMGVSVARDGANCAASGPELNATAMAEIRNRSPSPNKRQPATVR